jgi:hypothetical protein
VTLSIGVREAIHARSALALIGIPPCPLAISLLPHRHSSLVKVRLSMKPWATWQAEVIATLRVELDELLPQISIEDVDWVAWYGLYLDGRSPQAAVSRALERDL